MPMNMEDAVNELTNSFESLGAGQTQHEDKPVEIPQQLHDFGLSKSDSEDTHEKEPLDTDDPKWWAKTALDQLKALQTAVSVPLFSIVQTFEGDPTQFKQWVRNIERYAQMARLRDEDIPQIVHVTCTGLVADFVKRYIGECEKDKVNPKWQDLKKLLQRRFAEITDQQQAMAMLRKIRQRPNESVQMLAERLLRIAEDAYPPIPATDVTTKNLIQKQLVDTFCDGLRFDYLRMKITRTPKHWKTRYFVQ